MINNMVITLVTLAGGNRWFWFCAYKISPLTGSINIAARALMVNAAAGKLKVSVSKDKIIHPIISFFPKLVPSFHQGCPKTAGSITKSLKLED
jgi:hypothetical protein